MRTPSRTLLISCCVTSFIVIAGIVVAVWYRSLSPHDEAPPAADQTLNDQATTPTLYITTMTHMEGNFKDDVDRDLFLRHVNDMRSAMDMFDAYGAKLTFESEQSFAKANTTWDLNILREVIDRGHGVGTHADFGAEQPMRDEGYYARSLRRNKALVDALVGAENNRGLSGGTGYRDWVTATADAGFDYMNALTAFAYLPMPLSARPSGWTDEYIRSTVYHDAVPVTLADRVRFYTLADATDLLPDTNGVLTIAGGEIGELSSLAEGRITCAPNCKLTNADVDVFTDALREANTVRMATSLPVKVNVHIPLALLNANNREVLTYFLSQVADVQSTEPAMVWATQGAAYDGYTLWQKSQ